MFSGLGWEGRTEPVLIVLWDVPWFYDTHWDVFLRIRPMYRPFKIRFLEKIQWRTNKCKTVPPPPISIPTKSILKKRFISSCFTTNYNPFFFGSLSCFPFFLYLWNQFFVIYGKMENFKWHYHIVFKLSMEERENCGEKLINGDPRIPGKASLQITFW